MFMPFKKLNTAKKKITQKNTTQLPKSSMEGGWALTYEHDFVCGDKTGDTCGTG